MAQKHPLRFGVFSHNMAPLDTLISQAQKAERIGYATFLVPDHIGDQFATTLALAKVAEVTSHIRIGSFVFDNDFRHPVLLAKDAATLDQFSNGRLELGMGAGWMKAEYEQCGLSFDAPGVRIGRLEESINIVKPLLRHETVSYSGKYYKVDRIMIYPQSMQKPAPPLFIGGSGKRLLSLAGRHAEIVGFTPKTEATQVEGHMNHALDMRDASSEALAQKVVWVRKAAESRFENLELNIVVLDLAVTHSQQEGVQQLMDNYQLTEEQVLDSPHFLAGPVEQICQMILDIREQLGISYWTVWEEHLDRFAPIVQRLANQ